MVKHVSKAWFLKFLRSEELLGLQVWDSTNNEHNRICPIWKIVLNRTKLIRLVRSWDLNASCQAHQLLCDSSLEKKKPRPFPIRRSSLRLCFGPKRMLLYESERPTWPAHRRHLTSFVCAVILVAPWMCLIKPTGPKNLLRIVPPRRMEALDLGTFSRAWAFIVLTSLLNRTSSFS